MDAHSKWPEIIPMPTITANRTILEMRKVFATYGCPKQLVSDNGPQFCSREIGSFLKMNGVKHIQCSPYHHSSNSAVEHLV